MNVKKIINYVFAVCLSVSIIFGTFFYFKYTSTRKSLDECMEQFRLARERAELYASEADRAAETNRELNALIGKARVTNTEIGDSIQRQSTTLSGIRNQLREIETKYNEMEKLLNSIGGSAGSSDSNNNRDGN